MIRMQALAKIFDHTLMKAWKTGGLSDDGVLLDETVLRVAARHPITQTQKDWFFESGSFFGEVLKRSKRAGRA